MIKLTLFNDSDMIINADMIELIEKTPDTIITLTTGKKVIVCESVEEVIGKVITYHRLVGKKHGIFGHKNRANMSATMKGNDRWMLRH